MITTDLKLLVDVAWHNRDGQKAYELSRGEYAAADRLTNRGILVNVGAGCVGISADGRELVGKLSGKAAKG